VEHPSCNEEKDGGSLVELIKRVGNRRGRGAGPSSCELMEQTP
jgi:hypothetical protein